MGFYRSIEKKLKTWSLSPFRKPLVLRGARQVGKTTAVKQFASGYEQFIYLNLETSDAKLFEGERDIHRIVNRIFFMKDANKSNTNTLIFIDEIQEVRSALNMLRYFYEEYPEYHVIAAGSLLESLFDQDVSFPVGRVDYLYMYPCSFEEFLVALDEKNALNAYRQVPVPDYAVDKLMQLFHTYTLIGGMPEAVYRYVVTKDLLQVKPVYETLLLSYMDDVEKYATTANQVQVMRHCIRSCFAEAGERIKFAGFGESAYSSKEVGEAMRSLRKALILHLTYPTTQTMLPFAPDIKRAPRLQVLDTGMLNYFSNIQKEVFASKDLNNLYKGRIAEHIVGQELIAHSDNYLQPLQFWVREKNTSNAEVDFLYSSPYGNIPLEVKAGATGHLKSLLMYIELSGSPLAVRLYAGPYHLENIQTSEGKSFTLINLPYCLTGMLSSYIELFVNSERDNESLLK